MGQSDSNIGSINEVNSVSDAYNIRQSVTAAYSTFVAYDYWSQGKFYEVLYKVVLGPFQNKMKAQNTVSWANKRNLEVGLPADAWVTKIKGNWYVQVLAYVRLDQVDDCMKKLGIKSYKQYIETPKKKHTVYNPDAELEKTRKAFEAGLSQADLNDAEIKRLVDIAIGAVNMENDPNKLEDLSDVKAARAEIEKSRDYLNSLNPPDDESRDKLSAFYDKIDGHKQRLDDAIDDRELALLPVQDLAEQMRTQALRGGQGTIEVSGMESKRLHQIRVALTGGSNRYKVALGPDDMPAGGEKRVKEFMEICRKIYEDKSVAGDNVKQIATSDYYGKILKVLGDTNSLDFNTSFDYESSSEYIFAASLALAWAYVSVNGSQKGFAADFMQNYVEKVQGGEATEDQSSGISEYHYRLLRKAVK